jgi:hypothetical protein
MTTNSASLQTEVPGRTAQSPERRGQQQAGSESTQEGVHGRLTGGQQDRRPSAAPCR